MRPGFEWLVHGLAGAALTALLWPISRLWKARAQRRECFHHDRNKPESWITQQLIDSGSRKIFTCTRCKQMWFS